MALVALSAVTPQGQAQTTIDVSKVNCEQWSAFKVADPDHIAIWLHGYYSGKRGNTVVEVQEFKDNIQKVKEFCIRNPRTPLMQAVERELGVAR
jgi:hypothetical protein